MAKKKGLFAKALSGKRLSASDILGALGGLRGRDRGRTTRARAVVNPLPVKQAEAKRQPRRVATSGNISKSDVDYAEARQRLGDFYLAATSGFGSDFIKPPKAKRK